MCVHHFHGASAAEHQHTYHRENTPGGKQTTVHVHINLVPGLPASAHHPVTYGQRPRHAVLPEILRLRHQRPERRDLLRFRCPHLQSSGQVSRDGPEHVLEGRGRWRAVNCAFRLF